MCPHTCCTCCQCLTISDSPLRGLCPAGVPPPYNMGVLRMFYRRIFDQPATWTLTGNSSRALMHFDAVNWEAEVWVNQVRVGMHQGGYGTLMDLACRCLSHTALSGLQQCICCLCPSGRSIVHRILRPVPASKGRAGL